MSDPVKLTLPPSPERYLNTEIKIAAEGAILIL